MKLSGAIILIYGVLILVGGIFGHQKTGSFASLVAGVVCGVLILGTAIATFKHKRWGEYVALLLIFLLDAFFTYRFIATQKFMPAGLLSLLSLGFLFLIAMILRRRLVR